MATSKKNKKIATFENNLEQLEALLQNLENGETSLNELVDQYEKGTQLLQACQEQLSAAELKISQLQPSNNGLEFVPLDTRENDD